MSDNLKFFKGLESNLPTSGIEIGALYHCEDTGNTYRGISATELELFSSAVGKKYNVDNAQGEIFNDYQNNTIIPKDDIEDVKAHAEGEHTSAGWRSHAEGYFTEAHNTGHAEGRLSVASGTGAHAEGVEYNSKLASYNNVNVQVTLKQKAYITDNQIRIDQANNLSIGDIIYIGPASGQSFTATDARKVIAKSTIMNHASLGTYTLVTLNAPFAADNYTNEDAVNGTLPVGALVYQSTRTQAVGRGSHAEGEGTRAEGRASHSEGANTRATGRYAHTEGYKTSTNSEDSVSSYGDPSGLEEGRAAHAEGYGTIATGFASHSEGEATCASGKNSHTEGYSTEASGVTAHAEGNNTNASGAAAHAEGEHTSAGWRSHSEGYLTIANSTSHAEGRLAQAVGKASHAEGYELNIDFTDASGNTITVLLSENAKITDSFIVVDQVPSTLQVNDVIYITSNGAAQIEATDSKIITKIEGNVLTLHAPFLADNYQSTKYENDPTIIPIGAKVKYAQRTKALGNGAHAEGQGTSAIAPCSHSEGTGTIAGRIIGYDEKGKPIYKGKQAHAEGYITEAIGEYSHAEGHGGLADGNAAHKEGVKTIANGNGAHSEGDSTQAIGPANHAEGYKTIANNSNGGAHAEGHTTNAYGLGSHAEGRKGTVTGTAAHVEGQSDNVCLTILNKDNFTNVTNDEIIDVWSVQDSQKFSLAKAIGSHVEGYNNLGLGNYSHTEGAKNISSGYAAHAEGQSTKATNNRAHAEGFWTEADGENSHAGGAYTIAKGKNQTVIGQFNYPNEDDLFIVGNGTSIDDRKNIFSVNTDRVLIGPNTDQRTEITDSSLYIGGEGPDGTSITPSSIWVGNDSENALHITNNDIIKGENHVVFDCDIHKLTFTNAQAGTYNPLSSDYTISLVGKKTTGEIFNTYTGEYANIASGSSSHAEGLKTQALGIADHVEGYNTIANGGSITGCAHAEGHGTKALSAYSHAEGQGTITSTSLNGQHVQGKWNDPNDVNGYAHIVGWGTKDKPNNIHTLTTSGNAWYAGKMSSNSVNTNKIILSSDSFGSTLPSTGEVGQLFFLKV